MVQAGGNVWHGLQWTCLMQFLVSKKYLLSFLLKAIIQQSPVQRMRWCLPRYQLQCQLCPAPKHGCAIISWSYQQQGSLNSSRECGSLSKAADRFLNKELGDEPEYSLSLNMRLQSMCYCWTGNSKPCHICKEM